MAIPGAPAGTPSLVVASMRRPYSPDDVPAGNAVASSLATKGQLYPTGRN